MSSHPGSGLSSSAVQGTTALDLATALKALYAREINCGLASFWDGGWEVWIGDDQNGRKAEETFYNEDLDKVGAWLIATAEALYGPAPHMHVAHYDEDGKLTRTCGACGEDLQHEAHYRQPSASMTSAAQTDKQDLGSPQ